MPTATFTIRPPRDEDVPRLVELNHSVAREAGQPATSTEDDIRRMWARPRFVRDRHSRVVEIDGLIVAAGGINIDPESNQSWGGGWVFPEYRGRGIGSSLINWMIESARAEDGVKQFLTGADESQEDALALILSLGFEYERTFFHMKNGAPAETQPAVWPEGISFRTLGGDELVDAVIEAHDGSFIDHWNFTPAQRDELEFWGKHPEFDPSLCYFAYGPDGEMAGFCINWISRRSGDARGDLGPIGTTRPFRGIGLGRALLRHSVLEMAARGAVEVTLGVDSQNPNGALGLYERNGFVRDRTNHLYTITL